MALFKKKGKESSYISARKTAQISRFNRRLTRKLEKSRANANKDPKLYTTVMKDENNVVEFDNVCTYFFTDIGTVKAVDGPFHKFEPSASSANPAAASPLPPCP